MEMIAEYKRLSILARNLQSNTQQQSFNTFTMFSKLAIISSLAILAVAIPVLAAPQLIPGLPLPLPSLPLPSLPLPVLPLPTGTNPLPLPVLPLPTGSILLHSQRNGCSHPFLFFFSYFPMILNRHNPELTYPFATSFTADSSAPRATKANLYR